MIITFIGHRSLYHSEGLFNLLKATIINHIKNGEPISFYCGGYGEFDSLCARVGYEIKKTHPSCEVLLITPYLTRTYRQDITGVPYDSIIYPPLENVPPKFAISKRNEWMVNQADLIIAYVIHSYGGAYKSLEFAKRKHKKIINLANSESDKAD